MPKDLNSLRMRAERNGQHISGAERLLPTDDLAAAAIDLLQRALQHPRGDVDRISLSIEVVPSLELTTGALPDLYNNQVASWQQGRELALQLLESAGISAVAGRKALAALARGAAPGGRSMRGAMLIDADSGERLERDQARGVRVSRMDLSAAAKRQLRQLLLPHSLDDPHVIEALTLAAKVSAAPGIIAELCWSDDPDYLAGYVASAALGYQRINLLKPAGEERGGRAFFVRPSQVRLDELISWLEKTPLLFEQVGRVHGPKTYRGER